MEFILNVPQGKFQIRRIPLRQNELLQAWDAADEYLLNFAEHLNLNYDSKVCILNDSFGALAVALHHHRPIAISDSFLSQSATQHNLDLNGINRNSIELQNSLWQPSVKLDFLFIKIPKTLALLEYQLYRFREWLKPECKVIVAGMIKNLPKSTWQILESILGPTTTSLAVKKSRLIFAEIDNTLKLNSNPYPISYVLENTDLKILNHANVFSRESLDIGTRFLLNNLPSNPAFNDFIDLGCGNGVVGVMIARKFLSAKLKFVDESYMAIASAEQNFHAAFRRQRHAEFILDDCLSNMPLQSSDCIVCNPPFHQQHTIADHVARQMFKQSLKVLRSGGELRVIGNRHLNYHILLKKIFGNVLQIAGNAKFVIFSAIKN